jgi:MYXO-CTERM domain-containing protein
LLLAAALTSVASTALANGRFPAANHLVVHPADPSRIMLRATFGIVITADKGQNWDWTCEKAIGYSGNEDPAVGITQSGTLLAGLFDGLAVSADNACNWSRIAGLEKQVVIDVAVLASNPKVAVALTSTFKGQSDAGDSLFTNLVFVTQDDGASWAPLGPALDDTVLTQTIDFAASDANRLYVSGVRDSGQSSAGVLLVSTNLGQSWTERAVPLDAPNERAPFIAGVDPTNADRVYVRNSGAGANRLLYTDDAGANFKTAFTSQGPLLGFALSPDGSRVYVGGQKDGLLAASKTDLQFAKRSDVQVQCLMTSGASVWACSNMVSGFIVGRSDDDGATFAPLLKLNGIRGPISCGANTSSQLCIDLWPTLKEQLAGGTNPTDGGGDGSVNPVQPPKDSGGCSCTSASNGASAWLGLVGALGALAAVLRKRRASPRR